MLYRNVVFGLLSTWHRLECESCPTLLDEARAQFETDAGRVSFPFHFNLLLAVATSVKFASRQ